MRLLLDECVDVGLAAVLRDAGHDVVLVQDFKPGVEDDAVMALAIGQCRILVTADKDFGELVRKRSQPVPGLVLLRLQVGQPAALACRVTDVLTDLAERLPGSYVVIQETRVRIRPLRSFW